jgi:hypothetical protein
LDMNMKYFTPFIKSFFTHGLLSIMLFIYYVTLKPLTDQQAM